jgi:hypothetical protein
MHSGANSDEELAQGSDGGFDFAEDGNVVTPRPAQRPVNPMAYHMMLESEKETAGIPPSGGAAGRILSSDADSLSEGFSSDALASEDEDGSYFKMDAIRFMSLEDNAMREDLVPEHAPNTSSSCSSDGGGDSKSRKRTCSRKALMYYDRNGAKKLRRDAHHHQHKYQHEQETPPIVRVAGGAGAGAAGGGVGAGAGAGGGKEEAAD